MIDQTTFDTLLQRVDALSRKLELLRRDLLQAVGWRYACFRPASQRAKEAWLSVDRLPSNRPSTPISSSRSGQWIP